MGQQCLNRYQHHFESWLAFSSAVVEGLTERVHLMQTPTPAEQTLDSQVGAFWGKHQQSALQLRKKQ